MTGTPRVDDVDDLGRAFVAGAVLTWAGFLLTYLPIGSDFEVVRGVVGGCFAGATVFGTIGAGAGAWAAVRTRRAAWVWAAVLFAPVCALCWRRLLTGD